MDMPPDYPPSPPSDAKSPQSRRMSKVGKSTNRSSKRSSSHEYAAMAERRSKRVWKACERCRMKKTKCDGESPCKRCKDDSLVCTAGTRKKTEYKQIPRGYAEVLENTHNALTATVQKLYAMVKDNQPWTLGEPEVNIRGEPVIHDIVTKLGCIRASPDLSYTIPEGEAGLARLRQELHNVEPDPEMDMETDIKVEHGRCRKHSHDSFSTSPGFQRNDRASSSDSYASDMSRNQQAWMHQQAAARVVPRSPYSLPPVPAFGDVSAHGTPVDFNTSSAASSPIYPDFNMNQTDSFSAFNNWQASDNYLDQQDLSNYTAHMLGQQMQESKPSPLMGPGGFNTFAEPQIHFTGDTISPGLLNWSSNSFYQQMQ